MAWTDSRVFAQFALAALNRVAAFDLDTDSCKVALFNNTGTPDRTVAANLTAYNTGQWVTANEVSQAGQWAAGGVVLASPTVTASGGVVTLDGTDTASGAAATLSNVFGNLLYDDTLASPVADQGVCFNYYGGAQTVTGGQIVIVWNASGIATITT